MLGLEGVIHKRRLLESNEYKKYILMFDRLHVTGVWGMGKPDASLAANIDYLSEKGVVVDMGTTIDSKSIDFRRRILAWHAFARANPEVKWEGKQFISADAEVGFGTPLIANKPDINVVPIYTNSAWSQPDGEVTTNHTVLRVAIEHFPSFSPSSALEDILNFKDEMNKKTSAWGFRRFLYSLATKQQTEAEIRDDFKWTLNEYSNAMKIHHLKAGTSFIEVYIMPVIELVEDGLKFRWTKIAKGAMTVNKREIELREAEMKAPGRELAYVFEARKRFGEKY